MGTSGAGGGGGGSGGSGGGGGGSGGSGSSGGGGGKAKPGKESAPIAKGKEAVIRVLSRLKPNYVTAQFIGPMTAGIAHELSLLAVDIQTNKSWGSLRERLDLKPGSTLADVRDAILNKYEQLEPDSRIKDTVTATVLQYFEALCRYKDDVLYGSGKNATFDALDAEIADDWLTCFLRFHYGNVLQREEPKLPDPRLQRTIAEVASTQASNLSLKLTERYSPSGKVTRGQYLQRARSGPKEMTWMIQAIRG